MIEDKEFRELFQVESDEHLQTLDDGLLRLEKSPEDKPTLEEVFRAAHSIKGAARMMALPELEQVAHELESVLGKAKQGKILLSSELIDRLCRGVDAMRAFSNEAVTGETVNFDIEALLKRLKGEAPEEKNVSCEKEQELSIDADNTQPEGMKSTVISSSASEVAEETALSTPKEELEVGATPGKPGSGATKAQRSESIRVATEKLDHLMSQASELVVVRNRYSHRLSELQALNSSWAIGKKRLDQLGAEIALEKNTNIALAENTDANIEKYQQDYQELGMLLKQAEAGAREDNARLGLLTQGLEDEIRSLRMLPLQKVFAVFPRMVRDVARSQEKQVNLFIEGAETCADKAILEEVKDPLSHMMRNAIDHGIETPAERHQAGKNQEATIYLRAYQTSNAVVIELEDDGRGLNTDKIKTKALQKNLITAEEVRTMSDNQIHGLIFAPGFSTADMVTDLSGRGVGMDVVYTNVEKLKGTIEIESSLGKGTCFRLSFPLTLATTRALIFRAASSRYALPVDVVERTVLLSENSFLSVGGVDAISLGSEVIPLFRLGELLPFARRNDGVDSTALSSTSKQDLSCIVIEQRGEKVGLIVDELESEQEIVLKPHGRVLERVQNIACSTILETGEICLVLNGSDILRTITKQFSSLSRANQQDGEKRSKRILLAEDSLTTRTQEKRILEAAGYEVIAAVDGAEAFEKLATDDFDLVVTDVEMPRLDGLSLTKKIREQTKYLELPIILVTSLSTDEDKRRGSEAGANAYITKGSFDHQLLLDTVARLI